MSALQASEHNSNCISLVHYIPTLCSLLYPYEIVLHLSISIAIHEKTVNVICLNLEPSNKISPLNWNPP